MEETQTYNPTQDFVVIEPDEPKNKTASGLYVQEDWKSLPLTGTIKAVGPEVENVVAGDRVVFMRFASIIMSKKLRMCKEAHILAKVLGEVS